jgi:6,7-dimethyl-8-ribityllumazine synthase
MQTTPSPPLAGYERVAVVCATWHATIVDQARVSLLAELQDQGLPAEQVDAFEVPGAFEIPLLAQTLARAGQHQAIVAIALVVDGGIYRHDFVASTVVDALMRVQLDSGVPVISVVLTPKAFHEHADHQAFFSAHFVKKGVEAARACLAAMALQRRFRA